MEKALHFPTGTRTLHESFNRLDAAVGAARTNGIELDIANSLWPQNTSPLRAEFLDLLKRDYRATVTPLDYVHQREQSRVTINQWVDEKTHHKVIAAIPPNTLTELTSLVLVNAIYFKGAWDTAFPERATRPDKFYLLPSKAITIPFMWLEGLFGCGENEDLQWLALPYKGNRFQMVILLPRAGGIMEQEIGRIGRRSDKRQRGSDSIEGLERALTPANFAAWTAAFRNQKVAVIIPKFRISCGLRLNGALRALGLKDAFNPKQLDDENRFLCIYDNDVQYPVFVVDMDAPSTNAAIHESWVPYVVKDTTATIRFPTQVELDEVTTTLARLTPKQFDAALIPILDIGIHRWYWPKEAILPLLWATQHTRWEWCNSRRIRTSMRGAGRLWHCCKSTPKPPPKRA